MAARSDRCLQPEDWMSVNTPIYSVSVYSRLMLIFLLLILTAELVQYKHSQFCCTGKYNPDLENVFVREREKEARERWTKWL